MAVTAHQTQHALFVVDAVPTGANIECMQNSSKPFTIIFTITHKRAHTHMRTHTSMYFRCTALEGKLACPVQKRARTHTKRHTNTTPRSHTYT